MGAASPLVMMLLMFAVFYFILIRPQVKRQKQHMEMLNALQKGEKVITRGGIVGNIIKSNERELTLQLDTDVRIKVLRTHIEGKYIKNDDEVVSIEKDAS